MFASNNKESLRLLQLLNVLGMSGYGTSLFGSYVASVYLGYP